MPHLKIKFCALCGTHRSHYCFHKSITKTLYCGNAHGVMARSQFNVIFSKLITVFILCFLFIYWDLVVHVYFSINDPYQLWMKRLDMIYCCRAHYNCRFKSHYFQVISMIKLGFWVFWDGRPCRRNILPSLTTVGWHNPEAHHCQNEHFTSLRTCNMKAQVI